MATHDYVIDNATGANVRADINLVLQAILTNNSSSSAPSTTAAYMWWADTTNGVLKIRNSSNNDWVELLQLDGTLTLEDGSASTPALAFRDDLNTGIFSSAADTFNVATGGVERMELGSATVFNEDGADVDFRIEGDTEADLFYVDAGNERIGINISSPVVKLHQHESSSAANYHVFTNSTTGSSGGNGGIVGIDANEDLILWNQEGQNVRFGTSNTERMRIDSSGKVGIGTSSPTSLLTLNHATSPFLRLNDSDTTKVGLGADGGLSYVFAQDGNPLVFTTSTGTAFTERMRIDSSGKVGIGITNPVGRLHLHQADSGTIDALMITNSDTTNNGLTIGVNSNEQPFFFNGSNTDMFFGTNNTERMRIASSGDVLIGTSTAVVDTKLVVAGNINQFNADTGTGASTKSYVLGRSYTMSTSSTNILTFDNWGTSAFDITVFRRDNASPAGAAVHKVYLAFKGSGLNMTQAAIAQEHKVAISGIHGITFTVSENNDTATLSVTGDDNGGETQDFTIYIMARGNGNGTIVVA